MSNATQHIETDTIGVAAFRVERVITRSRAATSATFSILGYGDPWVICAAWFRADGCSGIRVLVGEIAPGQVLQVASVLQMAGNWIEEQKP